MLSSAEHYALMAQFEKDLRSFSFSHGRLERESKTLWPKRRIYQDGAVNQMFLAYSNGYAFGKYVERS